MLRFFRTLFQFLVAFFGVILVLSVLVAWRLSSSPVNSTFLTPYIEAGIGHLVPDAHPQIANTLLTWDNEDHSLALHADGVVIKNGKGSVIAEVPSLDIRLSTFGFVVGQFWPTDMIIDHPQIKLNRHADGRLYFADLTTPDASEDPTDMREALQQAMDRLTHAYGMRHLAVYRAAIDIHNEATNTNWSVSIPEIVLKRTLSQLLGEAKVDLTQKDKPASLEFHYVYDHIKTLHRVSTRFSDITPSQLVGGHPETLGLNAAAIFELPLSGELEVAFDPGLNIAAAAATLHGGEGVLHVPLLWDKPRAITSCDIEGDFDSKTNKLRLLTAAFNFGGAMFDVAGEGKGPADPAKYDMDFGITAHIKNWPMDRFGDLWPKPFVPDAAEWMAHNLTKGVYEKGEANFTGSLAWHNLANTVVTSGQGKITASHGTVGYIDGMPPVENVHAVADFDLQHMVLQIDEGGIGDIHVQPFAITITGLADNDQYIDIPLKVAGPIPAIIKLINNPPLHYADIVGLSPDTLSGTAEGTVDLRFELLKTLTTKDIDVKTNATLSNVASTQLVKGLDLAQGNLALDIDTHGLAIKGPLAVNKIPVQMTLQQSFSAVADKPERQVTVDGTIKDDQWKTLGIEALAATRGSAGVNLQITQVSKTKTLFVGQADLANAELQVEQLNWKKPRGASAMAKLSAEMISGKDINVKSLSFRGPSASIDGTAVVSPYGLVRSVNLEPLVLGRTSANLSFLQVEGDGGYLRFEARGKSFDMSGIKNGKDPSRSDPRPKEYHLKVDRLYTGDTGVITNAEGVATRDHEEWSAVSLHGLTEGNHALDIDVTPQSDGTRTLSVTCDDFGKMLKALGYTDAVKDGAITITGASKPESPRVIDATIKISAFSVSNLPVLMLLVNATSPFGFADLVTNTASFDHLKGTMRWEGDVIDLSQTNIAGSSVGINVEGQVDMDTGKANLRGTLVPFSMVNNILGAIPVLGDILTGGNGGGILAVAYTIKGSLSDPKIDVNPVSLLAPGFLRNLFFGGDDK